MTLDQFLDQHQCSPDERKQLRRYLVFLRWSALLEIFHAY